VITNRAQGPAPEQYLALLRALSQSIGTAVSAIGKNDLQELQASIANQETLCHSLRETIAGMQSSLAAKPGPLARSFPTEIQKAHADLAKVNRLYAAVLRRSARSVGALTTLYQHYGRGYSRDSSESRGNRTWSCEV
jgi:hypothetical protein